MKPEARATEQPQPEYHPQDRFGMAVAVATDKSTAVAGGPPRITAFELERIRWKLVNTTKQRVTFQLTTIGADPFDDGKRTATVEPASAKAASTGELVLQVRKGAAVRGQATRYHYKIHPEGKPEDAIDPELDIYP